jgi:hypothetical protein
MTKTHIIIEALDSLDGFEFFTMSIKDMCVYFRVYAKSKGDSIRIDHRWLNGLLEGYDTEGLDFEMISDNPHYLDFIDAFFEKLHSSKFEIQLKLEAAKSMPEVSKRLQMLGNHWDVKKHWNSTIPVKPINTLTINAIRLEMPQLSGVQLISTEQDALNLEQQILEKYAEYLDFEPLSGTSTENS